MTPTQRYVVLAIALGLIAAPVVITLFWAAFTYGVHYP